MERYFNNAWTQLAAPVELGQTEIQVVNSVPFTVPGGLPTGDWFRISVYNEVMKVTEMVGDIWTVVRNFEGENLGTLDTGTLVIHQPTAGMFADLPPGENGVNGTSGIPGVGLPVGGKRGQVLVKLSDADFDFAWRDIAVTFDGAKVYRSTNQSINSAAATAVSFDVVTAETAIYWDVANPTRLTIPPGKDGWYWVHGRIQFAPNATGGRYIQLKKSGATVFGENDKPVNSGTVATVVETSELVRLVAGDYIEALAYQDSGGALNIVASAGIENQLSLAFLGT